MRDYNFFSGYKVKKYKGDSVVLVATIVFCVVLVGLIGYILFNQIYLSRLQNDLDELTDKVTVLKLSDDISRVLQKQELNNNLRSTSERIDGAKDMIALQETINENLFLVVADAMPVDVQLESIIVADNSISITGLALNRPAVAEFQYNLLSMDSIMEVFVSSIESDESSVSFTADIIFRGEGQ